MKTLESSAKSLVALSMLLLSACASTSFDVVQDSSFAIPASENTRLGGLRIEMDELDASGESVFLPLSRGDESLGARLQLIDAAEESIDLQYFLMKDDVIGALISAKLLQAADRGVRVRFLLDDIFTTIRDVDLFVLNEHENIEVRLFNPIARRGWAYLNYAWSFSIANRRMHNKSFTVDGAFTIVGGRNLAAEYFSLKDDTEFFDLDVLASGPIVDEIAVSFDDFWNFSKALGIEHLQDKPSAEELKNARETIQSALSGDSAEIYRAAVESTSLSQLLDGGAGEFVATADLIAELPDKLLLPVSDGSKRLIRVLGEYLRGARHEILMVTPYFIPTSEGMEFYRSIREKGVTVRLITNSLGSTNHVPVHAAYERYRRGMLEMGVEIYETRADAFQGLDADSESRQQSTLHTKLIVIDRRYVFIGSLNLDPRSIKINTEIGVMIDSPELATELLRDIEDGFDREVYRLELEDGQTIVWHGHYKGEPVELTRNPQASWWRHFTANFYRVLPEGQL